MHILASHRKTFIPDLICGDFDSARQEVLRFYENEVCACMRVAFYGAQSS